MNIVLLSNHWYDSPRKAGFHHLANAWHSQGHQVVFATVGFSFISYARRDFRTRYPGIWGARNKIKKYNDRMYSYVHFTPLHPHSTTLPFFDNMIAHFMDKYDQYSLGELNKYIKNANAIIYESNCSLFLLNMCRNLAPKAKHIYRVSDDIQTLKSCPQRMVDLELEIACLFTKISVPCVALMDKFQDICNVQLEYHGVNTSIFDMCSVSPYKKETRNAVFCGLHFYDKQTIQNMAKQLPDVNFHIIGIVAPKSGLKFHNVKYYGEIPFAETIPFIKFAGCGLYTLWSPSCSLRTYTDSLKILQYRYCGLPIVAPDALDLHRNGVFYYSRNDANSCRNAIVSALNHGHNLSFANEVKSWDAVAKSILST
jgi:2-beta-glucuronyltransferase